jgi:hypothetical protein
LKTKRNETEQRKKFGNVTKQKKQSQGQETKQNETKFSRNETKRNSVFETLKISKFFKPVFLYNVGIPVLEK